MKWRPVGLRVLLEPIVEEKVGSFHLPDTAKTKKVYTVIKLGDGFDGSGKKVPFHVELGDRVILAPHGGEKVEVGGEKLVVAHQAEIMLVRPKPMAD